MVTTRERRHARLRLVDDSSQIRPVEVQVHRFEVDRYCGRIVITDSTASSTAGSV